MIIIHSLTYKGCTSSLLVACIPIPSIGRKWRRILLRVAHYPTGYKYFVARTGLVIDMKPWATTVEKEAAMNDLGDRAEEMAPEVCEPGHRVVWGEGSLTARIAIVGEAPGDKEEKLGRPFVGPAGSLLEKELENVGIARDEVWITNVVKCRPTRESGGRTINRTPTAKEVRIWQEMLVQELEIISPEIVVCAGALAANTLIHKDFALTKERGEWFHTLFGSAIATYHPAYLLRQVGSDWDRTMEEFRSDLRRVAEAISREVMSDE